ncbi:DUF2284 domain-containing protein [Methanosarcinales archaeon]|nr:MAG: DUF2284 domain-containing protein [Methanosarcinales archaeon]
MVRLNDSDEKNFKELRSLALGLGANDAFVVPASEIVLENRTVLKCRFGCIGYISHVCPPLIPTVDEFRTMLQEYSWVMLVDWKTSVKLDKDISEMFTRLSFESGGSELDKKYLGQMKNIIRDRKEIIQPGTLQLEKEAWKMGYAMAFGTFPGMCTLCASDDYTTVDCVEKGTSLCKHYTAIRPCLMGLGIRLDKTLEKLGLDLPKFPVLGIPQQYTIVLLD